MDHSAAIKIISCFLLITSSGVVAACLIASWQALRRKLLIVTLLIATLISSILAGVAASIAAENGLGRSPGEYSDAQFKAIQKAIYVTEIFHVLTVGLGKLSFTALFYVLLSSTRWSRAVVAAAVFLVLWTVTMIISASLECDPPEVWNLAEGNCRNPRKTALWIYFGVSNILIEVLLIALPSLLVYSIQMSLHKRVIVIGCFSIRILDIVVTAVQIRYTYAFGARSSISLELWPWVMCSQVLQTVTIISACVPYLREFLRSFPSGMFQPIENQIAAIEISDRAAHDGRSQGKTEKNGKPHVWSVNDARLVIYPRRQEFVLRNLAHLLDFGGHGGVNTFQASVLCIMYANESGKRVDEADQPLIQGSEGMVSLDRGTSSLSRLQPWKTTFLAMALIFSLLLNAWWLLLERKGDGSHEKSMPSKILSAQHSPYTGLGFDMQIPYAHDTEYTSSNETHADYMWENLNIDPMIIAPTLEWAESMNLPGSWAFPWDSNRRIYFVKVFHQLHCLKVMRKSFHDLRADGESPIPAGHVEHCLDSLRQDLMCAADDTPMPSLELLNGSGEGQMMQCKDFDKLVAWTQAPERNACYKRLVTSDYRPIVHSIERYAFCPADSQPFAAMSRYFEEHGHYADPFAE
ncbi:uncharacterized protein KD926_007253 [Aspergillus affinis]|uniref:uncharacterized protein n=1 Tax=Aspergillus affinis TaxID=1070780 RepID=UPI0022FF02C0|nr:uncharacterized protein KD926_007253 [Aspergillus affinis]KAI9041299.1 hypothetical protein KD926_007253 [Aspergillus affinis]